MADSLFWNKRRVLITGHTGFKGSWLVLWLQQLGAEIWGYSLMPDTDKCLFCQLSQAEKFKSGMHHFIGDLSDLELLRRCIIEAQPEVVFHLAAQPLVRESYVNPVSTWTTNVLGSLNLLEALKSLKHTCSVVMITTDKVYQNREWCHGYRETDNLGGHDPYSSSKAAVEIAVSSWRSSFCGSLPHQTPYLRIATARSGNVIGGGDWAVDRIVPDAIRALAAGKPIPIRNSAATRPWQHVLEPLGGYIRLAEILSTSHEPPCEPFNFGPHIDSNQSVVNLVSAMLKIWPGSWVDASDQSAPHEASLLNLQADKAHHILGWDPRWNFDLTVEHTVAWYRAIYNGSTAYDSCLLDIHAYQALAF